LDEVARLIAAMVLTVLMVAGCGGDRGSSGGCDEPVPVDRKRLADLPAGLDMRRAGTVTQVTQSEGYLSATAITESTIDEMFTTFPDVLSAGGFDVVADENEGVEADIFFAHGEAATGAVKFIEGPCEGQVTTRLTITRTA
jgi:hypothetical protein